MKDVIVIGAGYAGVAAAKKLNQAGKDFVVLEARDRVGGRSSSELSPTGVRLDFGATWIGPTQLKVYEWVNEVNAAHYDTYDSGKNLLIYKGSATKYTGTIPKIDPLSLVNLGMSISAFNKMARQIDISKPWDHPKAGLWDGMTLETWMRKKLFRPKAYNLFKVGIQTIYAVEPSEISLLFALFYAVSGDNLDALMSIKDGAQQTILSDGTQGVVKKIAEPLMPHILLNHPVLKIEQNETSVKVYTANQVFEAKKCILTVPPSVIQHITFDPPLPLDKQQLYQRMPMGAAMKCFVIYKSPFWRESGFSGQIVSDEYPVKVTFDVGDSTNNDGPGKMLVFVEGNDTRDFIRLPLTQRKAMIIEKLVQAFGELAAQPLDYADKSWIDEYYSKGCYTGVMGPNTLSKFGKYLRTPFKNIHFAGTETAERWAGYLDGAIESGYRAAHEVI